MAHRGTARQSASQHRLSISPKSAKNVSKSLQGSGQVWVVQVASSLETTEKKENSDPPCEAVLHAPEAKRKERNLDSLQTEYRAVELLSREYDSVLSNKSNATKMASEMQNSSKNRPPELKFDDSPETMLAGMAPALFLGQCFSLLAVGNAAGRRGKHPVFRWISLRVLYSVIMSILFAINTILALCDLLRRHALTLGESQVIAFYSSSFLACCLYVRLATRWASLCTAFEKMESRIRHYGRPNGLRRQMRSITAVVLILALVEHGLAQLNTFVHMDRTITDRSISHWLQSYFEINFPHVSNFLPFSPVVAAGSIVVNMTATFIWNFNDLFTMLLSVAISRSFRTLNKSLISTAHEEKDVRSWRHARETYNTVANLTRTVDNSLNVHVLLSFVNNFYFICLQLLHTVRHEKNTIYLNIYFSFSFGFLLLRAAAVSLMAASIYDESRALKRVLYSVSSDSYCAEVDRFIIQVTTDDIALTGCNFFNVTRSLLLTVVGTITTYEVVLVQFNGLNSTN